ncbi:MAG: 4-(cytidine 5'-diphospho)-2-C-methyl-D-erythritol kinase [Candidatus Omnitrophica bacterium]|nr:4-(cytidine 5'-diphospho)-2-C-methyl-D-erythritol kinase [Candidatus Omnitrophota bacterium]MDD5429841.1 4-(cytidine 5'-diphospho)-2-C-methyl-D-erythritol kinase [Candidatus Omnitrophota bacterium]
MVSPLVVSLKKRKSLCGSKVSILSPAKINLYLNITGKMRQRFSGAIREFHTIESVVERISLSDMIGIEVTSEEGVSISSNDSSLETNENLAYKAVSLLKETYKIPFGFRIHLKKNIPVGSGLGGGSSNAASTLLAVRDLLGLGISHSKLYSLGAALGSDVNFFLSESNFAVLGSRGEKVTPFHTGRIFKHFIIWPGINISTKEVYRKTRAKLTNFFNNVKILQYALKRADLGLVEKNVFNVLEKGAFSVCKKLKSARDLIFSRGIEARMTGSGSAFYTVSCNFKLSEIKKHLPDSWKIYQVKTFNSNHKL